jgi:hypothetical protein
MAPQAQQSREYVESCAQENQVATSGVDFGAQCPDCHIVIETQDAADRHRKKLIDAKAAARHNERDTVFADVPDSGRVQASSPRASVAPRRAIVDGTDHTEAGPSQKPTRKKFQKKTEGPIRRSLRHANCSPGIRVPFEGDRVHKKIGGRFH